MAGFHKSNTAYEAYDGLAGDEARQRDMEVSSAALLRALKTGHGPDRFRWHENNGGANWAPTPATTRWQYRAIRSAEHKQWALDNAVHREPCFWCGVRADIGCSHTRLELAFDREIGLRGDEQC